MIGLLVPLVILLAASLTVMSSISLHLFFLQLLWSAFGAGILVIVLFFDWGAILNQRWFVAAVYLFALVLLVVVLREPAIRETRSWIVFGPLDFQPVELMKVALILAYASYFSRRHVSIARWDVIAGSLAMFAAPAVLVLLQPDMGSTLVLAAIWFGFLLLAGLPFRRLLVALAMFLLLATYGWSHVLKDYQRARVEGLLYPEKYALSVNYSTIQSKIAIGSAGFFGKGYKQGGQTQLGFLTQPEGDYVLAALIEEWGLLAGFMIIGALVALVIWVLRVGMRADKNFEKFICLGVAVMFLAQFLLNAGSTIGLLPTVGLTFPFLSYGGSSLMVNFLLLAVVNSIRAKL